MPKLKCSVVGLGKLGTPLAVVMAGANIKTIGVDINQTFVNDINKFKAPVQEPGLQEMMSLPKVKENLSATCDYKFAIENTDATFIIVPTPSNEQGLFSNKYVLQAVSAIGKVLQHKSSYHLVVVTSTVMPGSVSNIIRKTLEVSANKQVGSELGLCYNPEFIALGSVLKDLLSPDVVLIGESDFIAGQKLEKIYSTIFKLPATKPPILHMKLTEAELAKLAINSYITSKITFANMISNICERIPGVDANNVTLAMGHDSRIGSKYLQGGPAYGGPCFPRDTLAFKNFTNNMSLPSDLMCAVNKVNNYQIDHLISRIFEYSNFSMNSTLAILGLSYKPNTSVIDASPSVKLIEKLLKFQLRLQVFDPQANKNFAHYLKKNLNLEQQSQVAICKSISDCTKGASTIVIMTAWDDFKKLHNFLSAPANIFDCWRQLDANKYEKNGSRVFHLGKHYSTAKKLSLYSINDIKNVHMLTPCNSYVKKSNIV